jgi:hypothetical protein
MLADPQRRVIGIHFTGRDLGRSRLRLAIACGVVRRQRDGSPDTHPYEDLAEYGRDRWRACSLEEADVVVHALPYQNGAETDQVAEMARDAGLPCVFFRPNDDPTPASPPHGVVYRTSINRDWLTPCERAVPAVTDDLLAEYGGEVIVRKKRERATVGFCGHVGTPSERFFRRLVGLALRGGQRDKAVGMTLRAKALRVLRQSDRIDTKLIDRTKLWGGAKVGSDELDAEAQRAAVRREFLENLIESDYGVCVRGKGNYSFRLYEVLAAGRIPLFIDTKCVLPYEDEIDWHKHCVWVDESDIDRSDEIVAQFHADLHPNDFERLQLANRQIWIDYLRPAAIYTRILETAVSGR